MYLTSNSMNKLIDIAQLIATLYIYVRKMVALRRLGFRL